MQDKIRALLKESAEIKLKVAEQLSPQIEDASKKIIETFRNNGKLLICGNGGSAADSQHIATELVHQFEKSDRKALPAIALTTDTSSLTAIGNDWGFDRIFDRQVEALGAKGDVLLGISTSGNSENIMKAVEQAKKLGMYCIILSGRDGGKLKDLADLNLIVPAENTARIQESHIAIGHIICKMIEEELFKDA